MINSAFRSSAATLLMGVIKADGSIKQTEIETAYTHLKELGHLDETPTWSAGDNLVMGRASEEQIASAIGALRHVPEETRMELVSYLWDVAASDGVITEDEVEFVDRAADALALSPSVVEIVRPAELGQRDRIAS